MAQLVLPHHPTASEALVAPSSQQDQTSPEIQLVFLSRQVRWAYQWQQRIKRLADIALSLAGLALAAPLFLAIALLIRLTSPGPVFYFSQRIGKDYRPFNMVKFRTMRLDADDLREQLRAQAQLQGELFKLENDPRVTPIGRLLRASSLDELPQLINVLRGEMSLVGPRPLPPDESDLFEAPYTLRYKVLPGITGTWQVNGRSHSGFNRLCELEMAYVMNWTLWQDLKILLQTIPAVLLSRGAY